MTENVSVFIAFGAGVLSFLSPCVLPLIPSYLCIIGSSPLNAEARPRLIARTISFISGFSVVFIVLSIIFSSTFIFIDGIFQYINLVSGIIVIILGLNIIFNFLSLLNYEKRFHLKDKPKGVIGAFLAGGAFGAGWTPCVGPVLAGILLLAANSGSVRRSFLYLVFYSAGLGLPFLLASFFLNACVRISAKLRTHIPLIRRISGALLIVIGILIIKGDYQSFSRLAAQWQAKLSDRTPVVEAAVNDTDAVIKAFEGTGIQVASEGIDPPDFTLSLPDGTEITLSHLKGKVVFLNFWATWCGPCRSEMPSMEAVYQRLKDRGFEVLAVNLGDSSGEVSAFMKEYKLSFPSVLDEKSITGSRYNIRAIPTTYIIDRRGLIIARLVGSINWNTPKIIAALEAVLRE
jgi:cytochrome c-type biogenesis protein